MSALPPKADMCSALAHVRFVPIADLPAMRRRWLSQALQEESRSAHSEHDCGSPKPKVSALFLRAQLHERLVNRVWELK